ncbi:MAG: PEP-CTERM sorting domain-containing protein [Gemmataceae bacterium]
MLKVNRLGLRFAVSAAAICAIAVPALAFFPPIIAPITSITKPPATIAPVKIPPTTVTPTKIPPVDPCVKPNPKPRHYDCGCTGTGTGTTSTANTPEPATLISAGLGMGVAGIVGWVNRKRKPAGETHAAS